MTPVEFVEAVWKADGDAETIMRAYATALRAARLAALEEAAAIARDTPYKMAAREVIAKRILAALRKEETP